MSNEANLKGLDSRSEEVQELMEAIPSWIQRWGITLIAIIVIGTMLLCSNIRLPQKIEIKLSPLKSENVVIISTPSAGKIHEFNFVDRASVSYGDTLFIFEDSSGNFISFLAPICGHIKVSGPLFSGRTIPSAIELLQIHDSISPEMTYYGYISSDHVKDISVGDSISLNDCQGQISLISPNPSSSGNYYIEVTTQYFGNQYSHVAHITISNETILKKLLKSIQMKL